VSSLNSRLSAGSEEPFQSFVPECGDRHGTSVTYMVTDLPTEKQLWALAPS
jgi:hypothetical protein